jgi:hypothetical protein
VWLLKVLNLAASSFEHWKRQMDMEGLGEVEVGYRDC